MLTGIKRGRIAIHTYVRLHAALGLNLVCLVLVLAGSYVLYAGKVMGYSDSLYHYQGATAASYLGFIWQEYMRWDGRLTFDILQGAFQRIGYYVAPEDPLRFPWWLPIGIAQAALLAGGINIALALHRALQLTISGALLICLTFFAFWSCNPSFYEYTLNPGNGSYCIYTYLFSLLFLNLASPPTRHQRLGRYILFCLILFSSDMLWGPALLFLLLYETGLEAAMPRFSRKMLWRGVLVMALFFACVVLVYYSPGFQKRAQVMRDGGVANLSFKAGLQTYIDRVLGISLPQLLRSIATPGKMVLAGTHIFLCLFGLTVAGLTLGEEIRKRDLSDARPAWRAGRGRLALLTLTALAAYHLCYARAFLSQYHGPYANDNPTFVLLLFLCLLALLTVDFIRLGKRPLSILKASWVLVLALLVLAPNGVECLDSLRRARADRFSLVEAYTDILARLGPDVHNNSTSQDNPRSFILTGVPRFSLHADVSQMLSWHGIRNVAVGAAGFPGGPPPDKAELVTCQVPAVFPLSFDYRAPQEPHLLRTLFFRGLTVRDYYLPDPAVSGYALTVRMNPMVGGSSLYSSVYHYHLDFARGWRYPNVVHSLQLTLLSKAEAPQTGQIGNPVRACWLDGENETEALEYGKRRVLRIQVQVLDPNYADATRLTFE